MHQKVLLYSTDAADKDTQRYFAKKGYTLAALSHDSADFWTGVQSVAPSGYLVLLSHGDSDGPSMVSGTDGAAMTDAEITRFGEILVDGKITLYLLSCLTGNEPFLDKMLKTGCTFVAPQGYAELKSSSAGAYFYSVKAPDGTDYLPWSGTKALAPTRASKPLDIA